MRAAAVKLTPLTLDEQIFAEEHYAIIVKYLRHNRLDEGEYYGIVSMGYLRSVKKWFARPELHQYDFEAIAWQDMRCSVGNERQKQDRRIKAVSLDAVIPGTDHLTLANTITYDNLNYAGEEKTKMKPMYDIAIPTAAKLGRQPNVEMELLVDFLDSKHNTMCLEYDTSQEATKKSTNFRSWRKNHKRTDFEIYKFDCKIYFEKMKTKKPGKENLENGRC